jgi:hypothetical protein
MASLNLEQANSFLSAIHGQSYLTSQFLQPTNFEMTGITTNPIKEKMTFGLNKVTICNLSKV